MSINLLCLANHIAKMKVSVVLKLFVTVGVIIFLQCGFSLSEERSDVVCGTSEGSNCMQEELLDYGSKHKKSHFDVGDGEEKSTELDDNSVSHQNLQKYSLELGDDNNVIFDSNTEGLTGVKLDFHSNNKNEGSQFTQTSVLDGKGGSDGQPRTGMHKDALEQMSGTDDADASTVSQDTEGQDEFDSESPKLEAIFPRLAVVDSEEKSPVDVESAEKENTEEESEPPSTKRRFFPLLYTFRTLFNSLLSELGGSQDGPFNSSDSTVGNFTMAEDLNKDSNLTINGTNTAKKTRFQCATKNITHNTTGEVKIVNSTELLEMLNFSKNQKVSSCVLVMFYAPWCHFCARTAPHYNALARAFPQLDVLAVDTSHFSYLNARFGTVAVPNVMLFHARSAVRFNHTTRVLDSFIHFVRNNTGLNPNKLVKLEPLDFVGPLPSTVRRGRDWLLWLAWAFVIMCSTFGFVRSRYGQGFITRLRVLWQEHQHIE